jgi:hypothetical protein
MAFQNPTEEFVYNLCRSSFLSLWSYANPRREGSAKELCDVLVVCEPHVLIFSVKYSELKDADDRVAVDRWIRKTVNASVEEIYGAERNLARATHVTRSDGQQGLPLPPLAEKRVHRISISLGGQRSIPLTLKDWGKGFVHCFDEHFVQIALQELDTIADFIAYLEAKENLSRSKQQRVIIMGGEEDLLAVYLHQGRKFPQTDIIMIDENLWATFSQNPAYRRRLAADEVSYVWDNLIEYISEFALTNRMEFGGTLANNEVALRFMARESRLARRMLSETFLEFRERAKRGEASARMTPSISGVTYVFFNPPVSYERRVRFMELECRCFIARNEIPENKTVIGIGLNVEPAPQGFAVDLVFLSYPEWPPDHRAQAEEMKQELGFFRNTQFQSDQVDEYPEE